MTCQCGPVLGWIALLMLCSKWGSPQSTDVKVFDTFNDEVGLMYFGSTVEFRCVCQDSQCKNKGLQLELWRDNSKINSTNDHAFKATVKFRVKVDQAFKEGSYQCRLVDIEWNPAVINYHLCADDGPSCQSQDFKKCCSEPEKGCPGTMCIVRSAGNVSACSMLQTTDCAFHSSPVCTSINKRLDSACAALAQNNVVPLAAISKAEYSCLDDEKINFADELGKAISLGSNVYYPHCKDMKLKCGSNIQSVRIAEKATGNETLWEETMTCNEKIPFEKRRNLRPYEKTKLVATLTTTGNKVTSTFVYIVTMDELVVEMDLTKDPCPPNKTIRHFTCEIKSPSKLSKEFEVRLSVYYDLTKIDSIDDQLAIKNVNVTGKGKYECKAQITHRSCSPFFKSMPATNKAEVELHESCVPKDLQQPATGVVVLGPEIIPCLCKAEETPAVLKFEFLDVKVTMQSYISLWILITLLATFVLIGILCTILRKHFKDKKNYPMVNLLDKLQKDVPVPVLLTKAMKIGEHVQNYNYESSRKKGPNRTSCFRKVTNR